MDLTQLLAFTMQNDASDLHLSAGSPPIVRTAGEMKRVKADPHKKTYTDLALTPVLEQDDEELGLMQVFASHIPVSQLTRPRESSPTSVS